MQTVFDSSVTKKYEIAKSREWIITNGLGSYASSTIIGLNTRGYHGLLVASLDPPVRRVLFLSKFEEEVEVSGRNTSLRSTNTPGRLSTGSSAPRAVPVRALSRLRLQAGNCDP